MGQSSPPKNLIADSVYYPLEVEGVPTPARALMDSGATISIVSLEFIKKIAAVGDPKELLSRCQGLNVRFDGYGGKPLTDLRVYLPLRVKCHASAEVTLLCAVDEGEHPEAEFLLWKGGMRDLGFKLLSPDGEDLLAPTGSVFYSVLGSQPGVACVFNVTDEVSTQREALEDKNVMRCQTPQWEVGDHVVIPANELRRCRVFQKGYGTGIILRKTNVNAIIQLQYGTRTFTRKLQLSKLVKLDTELSPRDPRPTLGLLGPSVVSVGTSEAFSREGRGSSGAVHLGPTGAEQVPRIRRVRAREAPVLELAVGPGRVSVKREGSFGRPVPQHGQLFVARKSCFQNHLLGPGYYWTTTCQSYDASCSLIGIPRRRPVGHLFWGRMPPAALPDIGFPPLFWGKVLGRVGGPIGSQPQNMANQHRNRVPFRNAFGPSTVCSRAAVPFPDTVHKLKSGFTMAQGPRHLCPCRNVHQDSQAWQLPLEPKEWEPDTSTELSPRPAHW
ncbi:MAG: hypothetical protein GY696_37440 [Gammaproteobacteria bacterium]|nr:hypothetical protein [Gammaproteobacteria bacterium]